MKEQDLHTTAQSTYEAFTKELYQRKHLEIELARTKRQLEKTTTEKNELAKLAQCQKTTIIERNRTIKAHEDTIKTHEATIQKLEWKYKKYKALYLELLNKTPEPLVEINAKLKKKLTKVTDKFEEIIETRACAKHKDI